MEDDRDSGPVIIMEDVELTVSTMDAGSIIMARPARVALDVTTEAAGAKAAAVAATAAARRRESANLIAGQSEQK
jgi:hypothetical protein